MVGGGPRCRLLGQSGGYGGFGSVLFWRAGVDVLLPLLPYFRENGDSWKHGMDEDSRKLTKNRQMTDAGCRI